MVALPLPLLQPLAEPLTVGTAQGEGVCMLLGVGVRLPLMLALPEAL